MRSSWLTRVIPNASMSNAVRGRSTGVARCDDARIYEVDNAARERAIGLPPWPESKKQPG